MNLFNQYIPPTTGEVGLQLIAELTNNEYWAIDPDMLRIKDLLFQAEWNMYTDFRLTETATVEGNSFYNGSGNYYGEKHTRIYTIYTLEVEQRHEGQVKWYRVANKKVLKGTKCTDRYVGG